VAAAILCLFLGNAALWMRQDVYSARNVDREAQQIVGSADVQAAVADLLTAKVVQPALAQAGLGPFTGLLSGPVTGVSHQLIERALTAEPAQQVAARLVEQVVPELQKGAGPVSLTPQQLAWIASPSLASNRIMADVLHAAEVTGCCNVTLAQRGSLSFGWRHVSAIRVAGILLPALYLAFAALALLVTRNRRRLAMVLAGATAATGLATLALLWVGPGFWTGLISGSGATAGLVRAAGGTVFDSATASLRENSLLVVAAGTCALAALAFSRRTRSETRGLVARQIENAIGKR
jgi:hypothetical protein